MRPVHLDTDSLVKAVSTAGEERSRLLRLVGKHTPVGMSVVAWYEFARGPRTPEQLALASLVIEEDDLVSFDAAVAQVAAETFRRLGSPWRRAKNIVIGTTAAAQGAILWTLNRDDFAGIPEVELGP